MACPIEGEVRCASCVARLSAESRRRATWFSPQFMRVPNVLQGKLFKGDVLCQELFDVLVNFL